MYWTVLNFGSYPDLFKDGGITKHDLKSWNNWQAGMKFFIFWLYMESPFQPEPKQAKPSIQFSIKNMKMEKNWMHLSLS